MIEKLFFKSEKEVDIEKKKRHGTWIPLHTDFVTDPNNPENKIRVTFVNGKDDPANSPEQKELDTKFKRQNELIQKLKNNTITFEELCEYERLKL